MADVKPGLYHHYKGHIYEVIGVARHSETQEEFVVYRSPDKHDDLWIRPKAMFVESVIVDGKQIPRFTFIGMVENLNRAKDHGNREKMREINELFLR
ncbi:MAG: DUF1653 domain-containing protein [Candidatus Aenigmarchaeota archaeon]|nr:DUF1653 domain-containing protein [Candidatus Aenigmarchaeota archaeon]